MRAVADAIAAKGYLPLCLIYRPAWARMEEISIHSCSRRRGPGGGNALSR